MSIQELIRRYYIKASRYLLGKKFMKVMEGPLKGYQWTTASSYEYLLGNYEDTKTIATLSSWLKPGSVYYDLGANVGYYALLANRFITTGKIYAFEPMPLNRQVFEQHLQLNKEKITHNNIVLLPFAISDKEKEVIFSNNKEQRDGNTYIDGSSIFKSSCETITVKCFSIDELLQQDFAPPSVIKIDVEGAEYDVLIGAMNTLKQHKPNILLATHDCHLPGVKDKCVNLLKELGYELQHTGNYNKQLPGLDDYIATPKGS
jgi:FkbM family methyltransferase